jgi:hypothetical protein
MMKPITLAVTVLCGLAGATIGLAGRSAVPAAACKDTTHAAFVDNPARPSRAAMLYPLRPPHTTRGSRGAR